MKAAFALVVLSTLAACTDDVDEPWFLDHDRVIAVRASFPGIVSGETSTIDALLGIKGGHPMEADPPAAMVVSPESLAGTLSNVGGKWTVTAPDEVTLNAARTELGIDADKPVPLTVGVAFLASTFPMHQNTDPLPAIKTVYLGEHRENPVIEGFTILDQDASMTTDLTIDYTADTTMRIDASVNDGDDVNWLTSCGTMHDFQLEHAYITIEDEDLLEGDIAVILRKPDGGVAWKTLTCHVDPATIPPDTGK